VLLDVRSLDHVAIILLNTDIVNTKLNFSVTIHTLVRVGTVTSAAFARLSIRE